MPPSLLQMLTLISHLQPQSWSHACSLDILTAFVFILQQLCLQGGEKSASNNNQCISSEFTSYWLLQSNAEIAAVLGRIMLCVVSEQISPLSLLFPWLVSPFFLAVHFDSHTRLHFSFLLQLHHCITGIFKEESSLFLCLHDLTQWLAHCKCSTRLTNEWLDGVLTSSSTILSKTHRQQMSPLSYELIMIPHLIPWEILPNKSTLWKETQKET